jgi:hypothetical protein
MSAATEKSTPLIEKKMLNPGVYKTYEKENNSALAITFNAGFSLPK